MTDKVLYLLACEQPYPGIAIHLEKDKTNAYFDDLSRKAIEDKKVFKCSIFEIPVKCIREEKTIKDPTI